MSTLPKTYRKKLIEVALPLPAINDASIREGFIYKGNPSALHKWWAQRPLAAARAVIFAQTVDDPSGWPEEFPGLVEQDCERKRLFRIIEDLVKWESISDERIIGAAKQEIWNSWKRTCAAKVKEFGLNPLYNEQVLPAFHDPFAGGGTLPLEAQRLGFESWATDLNPVAVLINKAMIEFPSKFSTQRPINPSFASKTELLSKQWVRAFGLADDIRYYGQLAIGMIQEKIGNLYPQVIVEKDRTIGRPELDKLVGRKLNVISWIWARTVPSPNPAFRHIHVPLISSLLLSSKAGKETWVSFELNEGSYNVVVKGGKPENLETLKMGTSAGKRNGFRCIYSGSPISYEYIKEQGKNGQLGYRLLSVVVESELGRKYLSPTQADEEIASKAHPDWKPEEPLVGKCRVNVSNYGLDAFSDLFTQRQLSFLSCASSVLPAIHDKVAKDCVTSNQCQDTKGYADAISTYLAMAIDKTAEYCCTIVPWYSKEDRPKGLFARHAIPMVWDFAEINPLSTIGGSFSASVEIISNALSGCASTGIQGVAAQADAVKQSVSIGKIISTDPPYFDNIDYADLSDFFYVWLRHSLRDIYPDLFSTLATPKSDELVASLYRYGSRNIAEEFFLNGMTSAMTQLSQNSHPDFPVTIYYAFKQSELEDKGAGVSSTGWETFLEAVITAGFEISGTWPIRTERSSRSIGIGSNALATSVVLVCRRRQLNAAIVTRREFLSQLKIELPLALSNLQAGNIAPVDLAQASIGPGMAVYTRYSKVLDAEGKTITVRDALKLINETLDEVLSEQEGDFDSDTRWAITWFDQFAFNDGPYGVAEQLSVAKVTSVQGLDKAGIVASKGSVVRLLRPSELPANWDPTTDTRLTVWETVHHLIRALESGGEAAAASLVVKLGSKAETARELAYRLYTLCERRKRASEALSYNALVQSWPEILRQGNDHRPPEPTQGSLFGASDAEG